MESDKMAVNGIDANSALKKHLSATQRRKRKRIITAVLVTVLVVGGVALTVYELRKSVSERYGSTETSVESAAVTVDSISATVSGSGTLADDDVEAVEIPSAVSVDTIFVEEGDAVEEGALIASVDIPSVVSAMADLQDQLDTLDEELDAVSDDTVDSKITAGLSGRVKMIYAQADDDIATVMYEHGALMLLSLDGLMAVDIETDAVLAAGDTVTVTLSDGSAVEGTVRSVEDGVVTVTVTDNGPVLGDSVTVTDADANTVGTGTLYIHKELKVTGYAGTVSKIYVAENAKVSPSTKLIYLTDTSYTANYDTLLKQRSVLEEDLEDLIKLYKEGAVYSPIAGVISSVEEEQDTTAAAASAMAAADTTASEEPVTIATVCPNATMTVTVDMDESDILSLEEGQEATVTIDSIGEDEFTGTVTKVNTASTSSDGVTLFTVEVTIDKTEKMLAGMSASVAIKIQGVENALVIPEDALHQTSATSYVYTEYDETTGELGGMVEVTAGLSNGSYVEITSGLNEGDTVYYDDTSEQNSGFGGMNGNWGGQSGTMPDFGSGGTGGNFPSGQAPNGRQNSSGTMPGAGQ